MATTNPQLASSFGVEGMFALTFHQSQPVGDHEDPALQPVFEQQVPHSGPCYLAQVPTQDSDGVVSGGSDAFLLPMECEYLTVIGLASVDESLERQICN